MQGSLQTLGVSLWKYLKLEQVRSVQGYIFKNLALNWLFKFFYRKVSRTHRISDTTCHSPSSRCWPTHKTELWLVDGTHAWPFEHNAAFLLAVLTHAWPFEQNAAFSLVVLTHAWPLRKKISVFIGSGSEFFTAFNEVNWAKVQFGDLVLML